MADTTKTINEIYSMTGRNLDMHLSRDSKFICETAANVFGAASMQALFDMIYPVGTIVWRGDKTNPSVLYGGTWTQIKNTFLWASDGNTALGTTGGAKTAALATANLPSHGHSFSGGTVTTSANNRGHTHAMNHHHYVSGTTGNNDKSHKHGRGTMEITGFVAFQDGYGYSEQSSGAFAANKKYSQWVDSGESNGRHASGADFKASRSWTGSTDTQDANHAHSVGLWSGDSMTSANNSTARLSTDGESQTHVHTVTLSGTIGSTGSGAAFSIMPPHAHKFCWERTA